MQHYTEAEVGSIYALGTLLFDMGYRERAAKVFSGLVAIGSPCGFLGMGVVRLEERRFQEAVPFFRNAQQDSQLYPFATMGLCISFLALRELSRTRSLLEDAEKSLDGRDESTKSKLFPIIRAVELRCQELA